MTTPEHLDWHYLFSAALDEQLSPADADRLRELLKTNSEARQLWFFYHDNECGLAEMKASVVARPSPARSVNVVSRWRSRLRPLVSMAAGLVIGLLSAQVLYSAVDFTWRKAVTIFADGFEQGPAPLVTGLPLAAGIWSGDFTEVVRAPSELHVAEGTQVLRFVRADYQGKPNSQGSYTSDVYRLIDLRTYRHEFADGGGVMRVSAAFNSLPFPAQERYGAAIGVYAVSGGGLTEVDLNQVMDNRNDPLAMANKSLRDLDRDPATWERIGVELRLPPEADFLLVRLGVIHVTPSQRRETFDGQFLDDIRISLTRRELLP